MLLRIEGFIQRLAHVPLGEKLQFAAQQRDIVAGQRRIHCQRLEGQQCIDGIGKQVVRVALVDHVQVRLRAQVAEQQKAALQIFGVNFRHIDA